MTTTLNIISDEIIGALDRPFDHMFRERVKSIFRHEAALMIRRELNKDGMTDHFLTHFTAPMEVIDDSDLPCSRNGKIFRNSGKLSTPIRWRTDDPFSSIGLPNGLVVFIYTKLYEFPYADLQDAYVGNPPRYFYENGYIYVNFIDWDVDNPTGEECIKVGAAFGIGDMFDSTPEARLSDTFFDDDTIIPLPEDLIQTIKLNLLKGELSVTDSKDKIIPEHMDNN